MKSPPLKTKYVDSMCYRYKRIWALNIFLKNVCIFGGSKPLQGG